MTLAERIAARKAEQAKKKPEPIRPPWLERLQAKDLTHVG